MPLITVAITLTYTLVTGDKTETLGKDVANPTAELELDYRSPKSGKHTPPTQEPRSLGALPAYSWREAKASRIHWRM